MRLNLNDYECINTNDAEGIIGYSDKIIKLYKDYIKQLVDDIQDEVMVDDLTCEINDILGLLYDIHARQNDDWYEPQLIVVRYNPMGAYYFKELKEEER